MLTPLAWHHVKAVTVENRAPDAADTKRLLHLAGGNHAAAGRVVHHVFIHLPDLPHIQSSGHALWIGPHHIEQYHEFADGLAFLEHDSHQLARLYDQPIHFVADHGAALASGVSFPNLGKHLHQMPGGRWQCIYRK